MHSSCFRKTSYLAVGFAALTLIVSCGGSSDSPEPPADEMLPAPVLPQPLTVSFDFSDGQQAWTAGFSDYDADNAEIFNLVAEVVPLPDNADQNGFKLASDNRSDDIFMFLKQQFSGLEPNTFYTIDTTIQLISNAGEGCFGIGGAPGEAVYIKLGFAEIEPRQEGYFLNVDQGAQSNDGTNAKVIGNAATPQVSCESEGFGRKTVQTNEDTQVEFMSTSEGTIWLFIGSDSGFEGRTELFYNDIRLTFTPDI